MDLQGLGAFLSALGGIFTAKAGATAGQLQGLLMGEDLTERRKRMKMAEEAHQLQTELLRAEEARKQELFPLTKQRMEQQIEQSQALFPLHKEALATQVDMSKLNFQNTRLWIMFQQGIVPSQISDPVLRAEYEPFFNYQTTARSLEAVQTREALEALLEKVPEEWRPSLEMFGRMNLWRNQIQQQTMERYLQGMDINLAQGELSLRNTKLNNAFNLILTNINNEGMDWDKRTPQQKIEAVKKWIAQFGLQDDVPEDFANMFQRVKSIDARQLALFNAQSQITFGLQSRLLGQQIAGHLAALQQTFYGNLVAGALGLGGGQGGNNFVAPFGFPATDMPPAPVIFNQTPNQQGNYLNQTALNNYLKAPMNIFVPMKVGQQTVWKSLAEIQSQAGNIYQRLALPNGSANADEISTLIAYDAGLLQAQFVKGGVELDWNSALAWAVERVMPTILNSPAFRGNINFQNTVKEWKRVWEQQLQQRAGGVGHTPNPNLPRGTIGNPPRPPAQQPAQQPAPPRRSSGGSPQYSSQQRRRRE
jgi:hypothetical protein